MLKEKLSSSLEDYLETIYNFIEKNQKVRAVEISRELNVSRASVTEALKRLADKKLINYGRYDMISMTELGKKHALEVIEKHDTLCYFFKEILGLDTDISAQTACRIEHIISKEVLQKFSDFKNFNERNPEYIKKFKADYRD